MKVYIAGPMRGYPEFNFPAFFDAEDDLMATTPYHKSITIVNPARHDEDCGIDVTNMHGDEDLSEQGFSLKDALSWDLQQVLTSDYLVLLKGWEKSTGALLEVRTAMAVGIPCYPRADAANPDDFLFVNKGEPIAPKVNGEVRVTSATGGQKGTKLSQLGYVDPKALYVLGEVAGMGAEKYDAYNYLKGYDWSLSYNAMQRHAMQFWAGEDADEESGLYHMAHAAWHCLAMVSFMLRKIGTDDRPPAVGEE